MALYQYLTLLNYLPAPSMLLFHCVSPGAVKALTMHIVVSQKSLWFALMYCLVSICYSSFNSCGLLSNDALIDLEVQWLHSLILLIQKSCNKQVNHTNHKMQLSCMNLIFYTGSLVLIVQLWFCTISSLLQDLL